MTTNPLTRRALIDQIPTEQGRTVPAPQPAQGIHSSELGRQAYNTAMALPGVGGVAKAASTGGLISRALNTTAAATNTAGRGTAALATVPAAMPAANAAAPDQTAATSLSIAGPGAGARGAEPATASNPLIAAANKPGGAITFDAATNTYSGTDVGANAQIVNGRGGGAISAQNMQAANQLASDQGLASVARVATSGNVPRSPQLGMLSAPSVAHSGNDFAARKRLENLKTGASSIMNTRRWGGKGAERNPSVIAYQQALQADLAAQGKQPDMEMQTMGLNAGLMREGMQQDGADRRDQRRGLIDAARLGMERETQGYANRTAAQQEQLRNTLLDPKATPEQRALAQRSLAALSGKTAADRLQAVSLPDTTTEMGQVIRGGQALVRLMEDGTVQQVPVGAQAAARTPPAAAIADLQKKPATAAQFDAIFGAGTSRQYLR